MTKNVRHEKESAMVLYLLSKQKYGIMNREELEEESDLVEWAFLESINDLIDEKLVTRFINMYDAENNYFQITKKGQNVLFRAIQRTFKLTKKEKSQVE